MGTRGPAPKRSDKRLGHTSKEQRAATEVAAGGSEVVIPAPDDGWHLVARQWYDSLALSGQSVFYESADWATAYAIAESMSREFKPQPLVVGTGKDAYVEMHEMPPKGASLAGWLKGFAALLCTEGDRRRVALELQRPKRGGSEGEDADVSELAAYRRQLRSG